MPPNANRWPKPPEIPLIKARGIGWLRDGFNALKEPKTKKLRPVLACPSGDKQRLVRPFIEPPVRHQRSLDRTGGLIKRPGLPFCARACPATFAALSQEASYNHGMGPIYSPAPLGRCYLGGRQPARSAPQLSATPRLRRAPRPEVSAVSAVSAKQSGVLGMLFRAASIEPT